MSIFVQKPGLLTSVQDRGRFGQQRDGISPAGCMDQYSMKLANLLTGNKMDEAVLETTLLGPELVIGSDNCFAVTGAPMDLFLNESPVPMNTALFARAGSTLRCGSAKQGCRSYISFAGGLDVPVTRGSKSTLIRNGIGGFHGRKLKAGDEIGFLAPRASLKNAPLRCLPQDVPAGDICLRVIMGPQQDRFTEEGIATFLGSWYTVTQESDRMGCRLAGEPIRHIKDGNIISDGIAMGAVQVPTAGQPIVMMSERQSMGGYTKIANVISVDLPKIAQAAPGMRVRFQEIGVEEAQNLFMAELTEFDRLQAYLEADYDSSWALTVDGRSYRVSVTAHA